MRRWLPLAFGLLVAVVCVRLAVWQFDRLAGRRAQNARRAGALADTVTVTGRFDFRRDSVAGPRAFNGVPGVWLLTPLVEPDGSARTVLRGFVPAPDGRAVDRAGYLEPETTQVRGVLVDGVLRRVVLPPGAPARMVAVPPPALTDGPHLGYALQWLAFATIALVGGTLLSVRDRPRP